MQSKIRGLPALLLVLATVLLPEAVVGGISPRSALSVEKALKRYAGVKSMMVNLMHGIVLVEADISKISREELAARSGIAPEVS